jgi:tRNA pseudouridine55 synthase
VVHAVKRLLPRGTKIGHAGTLDPFATGVLVLLIGKATRRCEQLMDQIKSYDATIRLGATTPTDDPESEPLPIPSARPADRADIETALNALGGSIMQRPPAFSAIKLSGRRAYDLARRGDRPQLAPRPVTIYRIEVTHYDWPTLDLSIDCGRGTYIRSIARDLGEVLGVGGYLTQLRRTRVGEFDLSTATALSQLTAENLAAMLRSI